MSKQFVRRGAILEQLQQDVRNRNTTVKYVLCVDVETLTDFSQKVRIGYYEVKNIETKTIIDNGLFHNILTPDELALVEEYATSHSYKLFTMQDFIQKKLYPYVEKGVTLINHNIAFDLGAMCTWYAPYGSNGFYLKLCSCDCAPSQLKIRTMKRGKPCLELTTIIACKLHPNIIVRRLTSKKYAMFFDTENENIGAILDTSTIGRALLGPSGMSLKEMGKNFRCSIRKSEFDDYTGIISTAYLDYMIVDVKATLNLFENEVIEYNRHGVSTPITSILSEASIGKAYFAQLGVIPFRLMHDNIPEWLYSIAMRSYYGARSEVKIRLQPTLVRYTDFKSQYPTVNALLHLQDLLLAESIEVKHVTSKARTLIETMELNDLQKPDTWVKLRMFVKVKPNDDILPCRFDNGAHEKGYAVCYVTAPENWYTFSDIVASKLLTGKVPTIIDAIELIPHGQVETSPMLLFGDSRYTIDLTHDDLFTRVIDLRTMVKSEGKQYDKTSDEYSYYDSLQLALKLIANSTSYGVLVETLTRHGDEYAGKYYAVPIAAHITGGARLLLAIAERLGADRGITYAMCDTDSMAYAKPSNMACNAFYSHIDDIVKWFNPLSPYQGNAPIFELEDVNEWNGNDEALYFLGVSCKRYTLYNKLPNGTYRLRKISAHATGRYMFDDALTLPDRMNTQDVTFTVYETDEIPDEDEEDELDDETLIPAPSAKMKAWQYLIWYRGIELAESGITPYVPNEIWSSNIARYQETMNTPDKLKRHANLSGIRPFSFIIETPTRVYMQDGKEHKEKFRYAMPFNRTANDIQRGNVYRLDNGQLVLFPSFDTLANRFTTFFSHAEMKTANGNDTGLLHRRHEVIDVIVERTRTGKTV